MEGQASGVTVTRTLSAHQTCDAHWKYMLSCADYEALLAEADGGCRICRFPAAGMPLGALFIDHDYRGWWAVRGLLCISCNSGLGSGRTPPPGADEYLANAWFIRRLAVTPPTADEPPVGAVIRDHRLTVWVKFASNRWEASGSRRHSRTWAQMRKRCSPLHLHVIAVRDDPSVTSRAEAEDALAAAIQREGGR